MVHSRPRQARGRWHLVTDVSLQALRSVPLLQQRGAAPVQRVRAHRLCLSVPQAAEHSVGWRAGCHETSASFLVVISCLHFCLHWGKKGKVKAAHFLRKLLMFTHRILELLGLEGTLQLINACHPITHTFHYLTFVNTDSSINTDSKNCILI